MAERPLYTLYKNLKAQNYDVPDDYNKFESALTRDGKGGADNRHAIYENLKAQNFDVPSTYERFYSALFEPRSRTSSRAKGGSVPMTAADRARFSAGAASISASAQQTMNNAGRYNRLRQRKQKHQKDFGRVNLGTHQTPYGGDANNVVKDDFAYNPETGKAGAYVTSDSETAYTQNDAEQKQNLLDKYGEEWNNAVDMGIVPSELDKADPDLSDTDISMRQMERRQEWLNENQNRRSKELNESMHLQGSPFVASGGAVAPSSFNTAISNEANRLSDVEYGAYNTAKAYNQMLRTTLLQELKEQKQRNENAGWWKDKWNDVSNYFGAMFNTMLDPKLYSQGIMDAAISNNLLQVKKGMEDGTIKKGSNAGNAAQAMLGAIQQQQGEAAKQQQYGTKAYQYGDMSGRSLKFMADFASSGWRNVMTTGFTKAGEKVGEKMALGALGKWFTKNTGRVLGDIAGSAALAATNQLGSTYNNVIERYVGMNNENGGVTQDKNGDLKFNEGVSLGKAIKDGFGSATIENFSEMFGEYLPGAPKLLSKLGLSKVSSFFEKIGNNAYYKWLSNATNKSGIQGVMAEISEEEFGTALHAAWGDGDGSWSDFNVFTNPDAREKQIDTCLGMFYSVGFMQAPRTAVGAINAVQYFNIKHQVVKADKFGQVMFNDKWDEIKSKIDVTTNADLTKTVLDATRSDSMTAKQKGAVINYAMFLSKLRGFNQASDAKTKDKVEEGDTAPTLSNDLDDAYTEGYNADDADKHNIQLEQNDKANDLAAMLHITPEQLHDMADEDLEAMTGQNDKLDQAIYDYQVSTAKYQGVMDGAQDEVDMAAHQAAMETDNMTDLSRGTVRKATIKATGGLEDYEVYIISGNIATHDDGSIDVGNSDDMIIYYDPTTGRKEHADAMMFADLIEELPAADVKAQAINDAKENAIKKIAGIIDGTVEVGSQFSVTDADGTEHTYEVLADNGDGTAMITIDGNVPTELVKGENVQIPYSLVDLQQMKDMEDQKRLEAAKTEREQMEKERAEQQNQETEQTEETQPSFDFNQILNDNGNVVLADVLGKDGNTKYPNSQLFLIRDSGAKAKVMELKSDGSLVPHAVNKKDVRTATTMTLDEYKQAFTTTSMIEDNSGSIEADRGGIEVEDNTQPLSEADADNVIAQMESSAETAPDLELTPDNWTAEFGEDGILSTPIGDVKMGENQVAKLFEKGRSKEFGMIKPTLTNPDVIIEVPSHSADGNEERSSSYLFIKTFLGKNGKKVYYFKSVTIKKDGLEISISSHYDRAKRVKEALMKGKLLYRKNDGAQTEQNQPSTSVTTSQEDAAGSSESKDTNISSNGNENNESLTFEDGTPIPVDVNGEVDLSQTDASHAAEWYDTNLGEDADDWLDGEIKKAKKVLEQAKNKKVTGTKPSELVASKKEKEAAIADAQAHYDSAISIRDSLKERRIAKEENTAEGRKILIEKARRKFARLKSAVKDDAEAVAQIYKETVGTLLHRLYDGTGIDVTDTIPLTAEEYVASNLGAHSLNYEGTETSKGVKQETGLSREDFAKTQLLAADGKGTTIDNLVHSLWENRPSNLDSLDTQNIRNAMLSVITSGFKASEARNYIENLRIAQAENILEEQKKAADNATFAEENKAESEQQTETAPESEEKTGEENSDEENEKINEQTNENINAPEQTKFPDKLNEGSNTIEVPEDATDEKPLGEQRTKSPFLVRENGKQQTETESDADVEKNKVDDMKVVDNIVGEKTRKTLEKIAKIMGANIQWLYSNKQFNGKFDEKTNTIYLTLDSSITEGVQFIFGHEMTHEMRTKNPAAYDELKTLVKDMMGEDAFNSETDKMQIRYKKGGARYWNDRNAIEEEVVADQLGKWIRDTNYAHTLLLKMSHPLLARLHEIVNSFLMALHGTEFSDDMRLILRSIEQAYVKTANGQVTNSETGEDVSFSLRQKPEPKKKGIGYKVFVLKDGKLYPPMVANPNGAATPVGVWLDADAAPIAGESKTGRPQVKQGGKGTQGGSGKLAYRPGWHLGVVPYAIQFNRKDAEGNKTLFPKNFVFAEVEYAADVDYQEEARQEGINPSGKYQHSLAGLKHLPTDGYYMYRTNPNPETDPWVITGAMKVNRILTRAEQADLVSKAGREPQQIQEGDIVTDDVVNSINQEIADAPKFSLKVYHGSGADFTEFDFDHMGEGAGSQVFGWGGYVTSSKKIGKSYATLMDNDPSRAYYRIQRSNGTRFAKKYPTLESFLHGDKQIAMNDKFTEQEKIDYYNEMKKLAEPYHNLYEVDIPEDNGSNYLDWDKTLSKKQQDAIREGLVRLGVDMKKLEGKGQSLEKTGENVYNSTLYIGLTGTEYDSPERTKGISKFLSSVGFTGIKYKAGRNFGGAKKGDTNYVIFKPEDMKITEHTKFSLRLKSAIKETETNPSDAQKESGNYKKGHIKFGGYDYTIENPKGSTRSGKDADGKEWKVTMHDTYGYIRGKFGKDGDHLDMFINDKADLDNWDGDVFVVDQVNPDGSFDEHKVMYGYDSMDDAKKAYLANYSDGWQGLGSITGVSKDEFDKWLDTSNRKLKPFADYAKVKFSLKDIKPVGVGAFGNIYNQFRGNAKAAIEFLKKVRGGEAVGALHHKDIGDIDLVWGKEGTGHSDGYGLSKLVKYHPEVLDNLQEILNDMRVVSSSKNRVNLESETHKAGVRLTWDGERKSWLLTAFKKETSASDKRTDTAATSLEGDTALSQTEGSAAKIDNSFETAKENVEKFSLKDEKIKSVAEKFGVNEDDVAMYANAVERGSTADAARARANIKRYLLQANEDKISSFKELMKYTVPVNEALKENFGDLDAMIEERRKQVEAERNAMESARKRAQEEEEKRQKHLDELSLIPTDELDKRYMDAIANNDESTAREMLDESARRKGYGDADSDYQGQGAWAAPSNPQYESDEARRADIENSPDVNLEDIALGYNLQPDDYFDNPRAYMNNTAHGLESAHVIKNALDAIKNGEKDVKVKVYRAVPTSVKEGKLRNGDWVTPSKKYAEMHGDNRLEGKYRIIEDEVSANQLWWDGNDANEFGFDDGKEYRYKNAKNNRKLNDLITYDNKGNVIPPSKRFNSRKNDIRFSLAGERGAVAADKAEERTFRMDNLSVARKDQIFLGVGDVTFSLRDMADGKESGAADMAEDLKSLNTPDEVDDAIKTAIDDMPSGWKMANKKMIHVAQALGENRKAEIAGEEPKFSLKDGTLIKAGTYFSGGGLVEEGLKGIIDPVVAVEYDEKISGVYRNNFGKHIVTADVRDVDPRELVKQIDGEVEYFHASPVCKNYSQAKSNHAEVELDKETAASTAEFINAVKPKVVTIENVKGYKDSDAMKTITDALDANGYTWDADVYNAADYGGYTNRERLIVRAIRDGKLPAKPKKMARKSGWYEAVADIIPTLTEKKNGVAPWMDVRLKADGIDWRNIDKPLYVMGSAYADGKIPHAFADELLPTLRTKSGDVIVMPDGKVYRAMGRVLARVSGVSDDYKMPFSENLSHTIIGNGIPTQLTEHVIAPLLQNTLRPTTPEDGNIKFSLRYDKFEHDLNQWKKDNNLPKDAQRPTIPQRNAGESAVDFLMRVDEYRKQMALWKTAPTYEQHLLSDDTALGEFNRELQRGSVLKRIAFQDSMLAIRKAQEAIMKEVGVDRLNMAEDAYTAENRSHGKGKNEFEEYNNEFLQPLRKAYHQMKKILGDSYDNVRIYMMAKHGLERDAQMAFKKSLDADFEDVAQRSAAYKAYKGDMNRIINDSDLEFGRVDFTTWRQRDNALRTKYSPSYMDYRYDENGIAYDYSGLSALFSGSDFEEAAHKLVRDIESNHVAEVQDLWNATNAATKKILRDGYKAGMMSKDTYLYVRDMYSHYIPLRGWDGTTADQVWDYVGGGKGAFNQTLKTAHGRTSIADDPIAYIENMAESGILLNNKNWVKQHLMLLAQNHPTSLLTLSKAWYVKSTDANGNEEWIPATPQITSQMNSNQVKAAIDAFEQKMENMAQTGDATQQRDGLNIAYPQTHSEEREHEVRVMKDGEEYVIYVNGDPQLAQAMNNTRAHRVSEGIKNSISKRVIAVVGRKMAAAYTSLSPLFIPSNYFRDLTMTLASTAIREDGRYNYLLRKNLATSWNLGFMLKDYQNGKLREKVNNGNATPKEQMFYDFMMNGGETGFVSSLDVEDLKKKFKNDLKDLDRWKANPVKVGHTIMDSIEFLNRMIEDSNRFAVYMTSIQYGRSIDEAVNDAKDVTLNFNRKGTGEHSWQTIRNLYLFINPAVQSLQTLGALAKHHPFKFTAVTASWLASGVLVPVVNAALMNLLGGDDDKDKYWKFTKWDRRNNLIMWVPFTHEYVKIPLAQEFRAFYGVGDMIASKMMGGELAEESWGQYAEDLLGQVVDMLPLDPTGYDGNIAVSLMPNAIRPVFELAFNVDFTGKPLFKDTEYNKYDPNFTKAYVGTPDWLVRASKMVNSIGNDYPDVQQNSIDAFGDPRYNLNNPAVVDHVLSSYLGGAYTMGSQVLGVLTKSLNDPKEIKVADIPLFSKFVSNPDDRPVTKKQGDEFWDMKENHDRAANTLSKLKKQAKVDGDYSLLERFYGSEEYKQYKQDDVKVKKYEEDKKKERAEESGEEYRPHKLNAEDIYKAHATPKDDFEDMKLKQLYTKLNGFKSAYDLLVDTAPSQSDGYYNTNKAAIDAIDEISLDKQEISELKKGFLDDGKDAYNAEDMKQIRELRKKILAVLEKANKVVVANQKAKAEK